MTLKALNARTAPKSHAPERIVQFGEGNFLRCFVDWIVYNMNQKTDFNSLSNTEWWIGSMGRIVSIMSICKVV